MVNYSYANLVKRLDQARSWGTGVTEGNRCALVVGVALNLKPVSEDKSFRSLKTGLTEGVEGQPFLAKFYVKAQDLAGHIKRTFGPPDLLVNGKGALQLITARQGVIFMEDCWGGITLMGVIVREATYDHVDLWDGNCLEIYKGQKPTDQIHKFVERSRRIWFWDVKEKSREPARA